jgi:hypothetical protein
MGSLCDIRPRGSKDKAEFRQHSRGVFTETAGQRAENIFEIEFCYRNEAKGILWDSKGTLPQDYVALLAPPGAGYGLSSGWGHGGASWKRSSSHLSDSRAQDHEDHRYIPSH